MNNWFREEYRGSDQRWRCSVETILVIYDDPGSQSTVRVRRILEPAGYDVIAAASGHKAMNVLRTRKPALVVLDICMPGRSGQDLCRQIRRESKSVPLLVLSVIRDVAAVVLLLELGADGYITEPFSPCEFLARVRVAMRH
jgi:DNA-binding response OmpR family regulator